MADKQDNTRRKQPKDTKSVSVVEALNEIIVYAERYAIGRHTYASPTLATLIVELMDCLSPQTRHTLARDITTAFENHGVDPLSTEVWRDTLRHLDLVSGLASKDSEANPDTANPPATNPINTEVRHGDFK